MNLLELKDISKTYGEGEGKVKAVKDITLTINEGKMIAIMGPSGSGKSTLLNIIGCLDKPSSGEYYINTKLVTNLKDKQIAKLRNKTFGFIVQYFALLEDYNVEANIAIPLEYSKIKLNRNQRKEKINKLSKRLKIQDKLKKYPKQLSGGQCQRVAIARALINEPKIILADEPTGALDKKTGQEVVNILKELKEEGKTVLIVTHDENVANQCDEILKIEDGSIKE